MTLAGSINIEGLHRFAKKWDSPEVNRQIFERKGGADVFRNDESDVSRPTIRVSGSGLSTESLPSWRNMSAPPFVIK